MNYIMNFNEYDREIKVIAGRLSRGDKFLAEELRNEMHIAVLASPEGKDKSLYLRIAKCRAIDYLKSRARNYSYKGATRHVSLEAMEESGFQVDTEGRIYPPSDLPSATMEDFDDCPADV